MFDKLIEQTSCLYKLNTPQPEEIYQRLDRYQDYTGKASYFWKNGQGLYRADLPNIYTPYTGNLVSALVHISHSIHFGIYLFTDVGNALQAPKAMKILADIADKSNHHQKIILFAGQDLDIPYFLEKKFTVIEHKLPTSRLHSANEQQSLLVS